MPGESGQRKWTLLCGKKEKKLEDEQEVRRQRST
jgi:hypothetical protein